ncbi:MULTISPECIES: bifunctional DNA-formamidopyrimidine glycosylase/DNA-(apurinic or apyrimidinic site) lyase [Candidatus Ichthyocystis]|uniref:bifunctional DNA-formamidopyrimidine glycosylase/DNA-(apurinic or apyrimidinic site) lyase n=1 Tax=Candidatus Ichthyocystis TaxID=2929841 RepID=UPI000AEB44F8|nr:MULTISPECIES: bifunctional DNA-formamidopyrimidine glycosylase/DNA-(apurinic or apyrimidinic site) lyase [Ichthyocystis]
MPELPEVEVVRRGLENAIVGARVDRIDVRQSALRYPVTDNISGYCSGSYFQSVSRRAKYLILALSTGGYLLVHLGMSGSLCVLPEDVSPGKHDIVDIVLHDGRVIRLCDHRRFGCFLYADTLIGFSCLRNIGCEPLSNDFSASYLRRLVMNRRSSIKACLMNSQIVAGIGNIYANEILFESRINPLRHASSLTTGELSRLVKEIKRVLERAIDKGGTTLRDFLNASGQQGSFQNSLRVYGRAGMLCLSCLHCKVETVRSGQRSTFYCPSCQV